VQNPQDPHGLSTNLVCDDQWRSLNDKLAGAFDPAWAATLGEACQPFNLLSDAFIDSHSGLWALGLNVIEDSVAVGLREWAPLQAYHLARFAKRSGAARGKMCFHPFVRNARTRIVERLLHFGAEPSVMRGIA
jgi:hypothetical protein